MLRIPNKNINEATTKHLEAIQDAIDLLGSYAQRVDEAKARWKSKVSTNDGKSAFAHVRSTLAKMCVGSVRCAYCEDSAGDEVEHIYPRSLFPEKSFVWNNYLFACGPCNGPKGNQYAYINNDALVVFERKKGDPVMPPPAGQAALIDPRFEDPMDLLELDLGGVTPDGLLLEPTFEMLPIEGLSFASFLRAKFTIEALDLNREIITVARGNAFNGFRARMLEYTEEREKNDGPRLAALKEDFLKTPHLTVFYEMRRQRASLPTIDAFLRKAPEMEQWKLFP